MSNAALLRSVGQLPKICWWLGEVSACGMVIFGGICDVGWYYFGGVFVWWLYFVCDDIVSVGAPLSGDACVWVLVFFFSGLTAHPLIVFCFPFMDGASCFIYSWLSRRTADPLVVSLLSFVCGPPTLFMSGPPALLLCLFFPFQADRRLSCCVSISLPGRTADPLLCWTAGPLVVFFLLILGGLPTLFPGGPPTLLLCLLFPSLFDRRPSCCVSFSLPGLTLLWRIFFPFQADRRPFCCVSTFLPGRTTDPLLR